jgi:hypothetical protein
MFAIAITFYSEPLKYFRWLRKQFADKSESNFPNLGECYIPTPHPSSYAPEYIIKLRNITR